MAEPQATILVVDDEVKNVKLMEALLTPSIAHSKAYTAAMFRRTSTEIGKLAETRPQFFGSIVNIGLAPLPAAVDCRFDRAEHSSAP